MIYLDLFAGIGGFALGAYWAGWRFDEHYYSEVDEYACKIYERRFPDAVALGDIRSIDTAELPKGEWIITGGFPCQDISIAGPGVGIEGKRSSLWFEMRRIIRDLRPIYVIAENVGAITFRGLDAVLGSLAEIGFDAEWQDIRASDVGAPHRRVRIWIVAYPSGQRRKSWGTECARQERCVTSISTSGVSYSFGTGGRKNAPATSLGEKKKNDQQSVCVRTDVADTSGWRERKLSVRQRRSHQTARNASGCREDVADSEKTYGRGTDKEKYPGRGYQETGRCGLGGDRSEYWIVEPDVGRVAHGIPSRVDRLKCLGNAIVPQIAEILFRRLRELIDE